MSRRLRMTTVISDADSGLILERYDAVMSEEKFNNICSKQEDTYSIADIQKDLTSEEVELINYNYFGLKNLENSIKTHEQHLEEFK
jgi:hypothetical protein